MKERFAIITFVPACLFMMAAMINGSPAKNDNDITVRYGRDIRPLLSDRCFLCHGPDRETQKAGLRLDSFGEATLVRDGQAAIVPGDPEQSLLWKRITTDNPRKKMPPEDSGKHRLAPEELERIRTWIESGAEYEPHWAFAAIEKPAPPPLDNAQWCKNPIDVFILDELRSAGMRPNDEADRRTLARRVFLDLTGLPPTPEEIDLFLSDAEPNAYERLVDRLLTEEPYVTRYAERMATPWLDLSRYADTSGIHMDNGRTIWPWRDWVLDAYRTNMPYDQFVVEQLAGDLIENASTAQMVASGFNRNHTITDEGGAIDEEYLLEYAVDRTNTVGTVFLGLTVGCGRCHDHKFDPISTEEFYSLLAFSNNNEEPGIYSQTADPYRAYEPAYSLISDTERKRIEGFVTLIDELKAEQAIRTPEEQKLLEEFRTTLFAEGEWTWETPSVLSARSESASTFTIGDDSSVLVGGEAPANDEYVITLSTESTDLRAIALEVIADPALPAGRVGRADNGNAIMSGFTAEVVSVTDPSQRRALNLTWAWADIEQANGDYKVANVLRPDDGRVWAVDAHTTPGNRIAMFTTAEPFGFEGGSTVELRLGFTSPYPKHSFGKLRTRLGHTQESALARLPIASTNWYIAGPYPTASGEEAYDTAFGPEESGPLAFGKNYGGYSWRYASGVREAEIVTLAQVIGAEYVGRELYVPSSREVQLSLGSDDGLQVYLNGELVHENRISRGAAPDQDVVSMTLQPGRNTLVCKVINTGGPAAIYHRQVPQETELPHGTVSFLLPEDALPEKILTQARIDWRSRYSPDYQRISGEIKAVEQAKESAESGIPQTMVMQERSEVRPTYVLARGMYDQPIMDRPVERGVPQVLGTLGKSDQSASRIDLAEWLIGDENTLTARVTVNRFWELLFGTGLVETSDDFGLQGSWPSHPELLDWLAVEFKNNGWDCLLYTSPSPRDS